MLVHTTKGLLPFENLTVKDVAELGDNHRKLCSRWYLGDELVREDVVVNVLRPFSVTAQEGRING